jgi:Flp pilus assembly protein TadD
VSDRGPLEEAVALHRAGDLEGAVARYRDLIDTHPDQAEPWHLMGVAVHQMGNSALGRSLIEAAIALDGQRAAYHSNLAQVLRALGEDGGAEASLRQAIALDPRDGKALANLASVLRAHGRFAEALDAAERAIAVAPTDAETHNNLGNARKDAGRTEAAVAAYAKAIALAPDFALAHWNLALALLALGRYPEGFAEMQWRWRWPGFPSRPRRYDAPLWQGEAIAGQTLLLYPEQGLGDTIQWLRFVPEVRARGARVVLELPTALAPLVPSDYADAIVVADAALPRFDHHAPLGDLPHLLGTTLDTVPARVPYLRADPALVATMRARTPGGGRRRVGLNRAGNPASPIERFRHVPPDQLAPLARLANIDWIDIPKAPGNALAPVPGLTAITTADGPLTEAAALIETLDLVVTTDTAVAHLAGALAKPTFLLLHHAPDWRWLLDRQDSPWYPSLRLFRQTRPGDWHPVVSAVAEALARRV